MIGDGDSSVNKKLYDVMAYGPNFLIEQIECRNHILRNSCQKWLNILVILENAYQKIF